MVETAKHSVEVPLPVEEAHAKWLAWVGERVGSQQGSGEQVSEEVDRDQLPAQPAEADKGTVYFNSLGEDSTRVTLQIRYNPDAVKEAGLAPDYVGQRISLYLQRYSDFAQGREGTGGA
jgi:hypothetical protein